MERIIELRIQYNSIRHEKNKEHTKTKHIRMDKGRNENEESTVNNNKNSKNSKEINKIIVNNSKNSDF